MNLLKQLHYKIKLMKWINKIGSNADITKVLSHINKHVKEYDIKVETKNTFDIWCNSMINLILIYKRKCNEEIDYKSLYERLQYHASKDLPYNIQEDGTIKNQGE